MKSRSFTRYVVGHYKDELWGLAPHPTQVHLAATSGDDGTVRVWDLRRHVQERAVQHDAMMRSVAWTPDGSYLGVGMGGEVGRGRKEGVKDGYVSIPSLAAGSCYYLTTTTSSFLPLPVCFTVRRV